MGIPDQPLVPPWSGALAGSLDISLHEGHVGSAHDVSLIPEEYLGSVWRGWGMWSLLEGGAAPGTEAPKGHRYPAG